MFVVSLFFKFCSAFSKNLFTVFKLEFKSNLVAISLAVFLNSVTDCLATAAPPGITAPTINPALPSSKASANFT